jgi:hypothetical protein
VTAALIVIGLQKARYERERERERERGSACREIVLYYFDFSYAKNN